MIRKLCTEEAAGAELTDKLTENLKETLCDNKVAVVIIKCVMLGSLHSESARPRSVVPCGLDAVCSHAHYSLEILWLYPFAKQKHNILKGLWLLELGLQR